MSCMGTESCYSGAFSVPAILMIATLSSLPTPSLCPQAQTQTALSLTSSRLRRLHQVLQARPRPREPHHVHDQVHLGTWVFAPPPECLSSTPGRVSQQVQGSRQEGVLSGPPFGQPRLHPFTIPFFASHHRGVMYYWCNCRGWLWRAQMQSPSSGSTCPLLSLDEKDEMEDPRCQRLPPPLAHHLHCRPLLLARLLSRGS